jgi:nicotinamidase-related amidase
MSDRQRTPAPGWQPNPRHRLALLLVDVDNAFFDPRGAFYFPGVEAVVDPLRELLAAARARGRLVVHARERHHAGLADFEGQKLPVHCVGDEFDALPFPGFEALPGEPVIPKRRYSAFFATELALLLREQGTERVIIAGVKTNVCIRATVQDAFAHGFQPIVVRGTVDSNRPHLHEAALEDIARYFGEVVPFETAIDWLTTPEDAVNGEGEL